MVRQIPYRPRWAAGIAGRHAVTWLLCCKAQRGRQDDATSMHLRAGFGAKDCILMADRMRERLSSGGPGPAVMIRALCALGGSVVKIRPRLYRRQQSEEHRRWRNM